MKKLITIILSLVLAAALLAGCGAGGNGSSADYRAVIQSVRNPDMDGMFPIVTNADEDAQTMYSSFIGLEDEWMQRYALSASVIIVRAYSTAIILPVEGHEQDIRDALTQYVDSQKQNFDGYLADQYAIANSAIIDTAPTGEILFVMDENATEVMQALKDGLK